KMGTSDLIQETLIIASQEFQFFLGRTTIEFAHWLEGILNHVAERARRKFTGTCKRAISHEVPLTPDMDTVLLPVDHQSPDRIAEEKERCQLVRWALGQMRPLDRLLLHKHDYQGLTFAQIGRLIGRSEGATRALTARAHQRMAQVLRARYGKLQEEL